MKITNYYIPGLIFLMVILLICFNITTPITRYDDSPSSIQLSLLWENPDGPYLRQLRLKYHVDDLIKETSNDYEKILIVTHWVSNLWKHHPRYDQPFSDPISILELVEKGERFTCVEYSVVLAGVLNSLGITTRVLALKMSDVETKKEGAGHVVVEAFVDALDKWVMIDGQTDAIPTLDGIPLNAVEFQQALASNNPNLSIDSLDPNGLAMAPNIQEYFKWISPYLYFMDIPLDNRISKKEEVRLMLVPVGAKNPTVFQQTTLLNNFLYTHSIDTFYKRPVR